MIAHLDIEQRTGLHRLLVTLSVSNMNPLYKPDSDHVGTGPGCVQVDNVNVPSPVLGYVQPSPPEASASPFFCKTLLLPRPRLSLHCRAIHLDQPQGGIRVLPSIMLRAHGVAPAAVIFSSTFGS